MWYDSVTIQNHSLKRGAKMLDLLALTNAAAASVASLLELSNGVKNSELKRQVAELNVQIATIQNEAASLMKKNGRLKKELERIKDDRANPLVFNPEDGLYYDDKSDVPYCPNCYEGKNKERRHLKVSPKICPNCHEPFYEKGIGIAVAHPRGSDSGFEIY